MDEELPEEESKQCTPAFQGFRKPKKKHYFCLPNEWTDITAEIDNLPELKIIEYVVRHTWGFQNYDNFQDISVDEFMYGRKHRDGSRMDKGTGLSETGAKRGIARATEHGYIVCEIDDTDKGRVIKSYKPKMLSMDELGGFTETPQGLAETLGGLSETARGSQENPRTDKEMDKDTLKRHREKKDSPLLSPEALAIFNWCHEDGEYEPKLEAKIIEHCEKIAKQVKTREQYNAYRDFIRPGIKGPDKTVYLGNMAGTKNLNAWLKSQEVEQKEQEQQVDEQPAKRLAYWKEAVAKKYSANRMKVRGRLLVYLDYMADSARMFETALDESDTIEQFFRTLDKKLKEEVRV